MRLILGLCLLLALVSCRDASKTAPIEDAHPSNPPDASAGNVVATYSGGILTTDDLDREILQRGLGAAAQEAADPTRWTAELASKIIVERLLLERATLVGADRDSEMVRAEHRIRRDLYSAQYVAQQAGTLDTLPRVTEQDVEAYYREHLERFQRPERRETYHIFKRSSPGTGRAEVEAELLALRQRVLAGEAFALVAREASDSETRHRDGYLGQVARGRFPQALDDVIFGLQSGVPSEPILNADGGHLFLVSDILEARAFALDEVRAIIRRELDEQGRGAALRELARRLGPPPGSFVPTRAELPAILGTGDQAVALLEIGDYRLTLGHFQQLFEQERRLLGAKAPPDLALELLDEIRDRETIYQHLSSEGAPTSLDEQVAALVREALLEHIARRLMIALVEREPATIRGFFETRQLRYSTPARLRLGQVTVPAEHATTTVMSELEAAVSKLDSGELTLAMIAERYDGVLEEIGPVTSAQLQRRDPGALAFAFRLQPGRHSPPYSHGPQLRLFRVTAREEPRPQPLALVRDQVLRDFVAQNSASIFDQLSKELLAEAEFVLTPPYRSDQPHSGH